MRHRALVLLPSAFLAVFMVLAADSAGADLSSAGPDTGISVASDPDCTGPPRGATPIAYRVLLTQGQRRTGGGPTLVPAGKGEPAVQDRQEISSEQQYLRVLGRHSDGIDWTSSRVVVVELTTTYKLGALESTVELSGIYQDADGIYIGTNYTQYGPCQGIAQQEEWFSYDSRYLLILVPAKPGAVLNYYYCIVGGCPPDIP